MAYKIFMPRLLILLLCCGQLAQAVSPNISNAPESMAQGILEDKWLTPEQKQFLYLENFANDLLDPALRRDASGRHVVSPKFDLQYFIVPLDLVNEYKVEKILDPRIKDALIFMKDGRQYLKWPIHPEDRKYYLGIKELLKAHGLSEQESTPVTENPLDPNGIDSYLTASRSMVLRSRKNGLAFSLKGSTNYIGGKEDIRSFFPKIMTGQEAENIIRANKYVYDFMPKNGLKNLILQQEPLAFVIKKIGKFDSTGIVIRDLGDLGEGPQDGHRVGEKFSYVPGFSIIQSKNLPALKALVADSLGKKPEDISNEDLSNFVTKHYALPAGLALGELLAYFGIYMVSLHGQQLLIQIDSKGQPTGKIILRDFLDSMLINKLVPDRNKAQEMQCCFMLQKFPDYFPVMNLIKFHKMPPWADDVKKRAWMLGYENGFNHAFSHITGIPADNRADYVRLLGRTKGRYNTTKWDAYLKEFHVPRRYQ